MRCGAHSLVIPLCSSCVRFFALETTGARCTVCGKILISENGLCSSCRTAPVLKSLDGVFPLHTYSLWKKHLLFLWKTGDRRTLSVYFAAAFYRKLRKIEQTVGTVLPVVPVPPRPGKIRSRGWDQVDELCRCLHDGWNVQILHILERFSKKQQKKLGRTERILSGGASYRIVTPRKRARACACIPDSVVLADDVLTTGATIESCAEQLKRAGVRTVYAVTLFSVG